MQPSLAEGLEDRQEFTVTPEMSPPHLPVAVLSTPSMVSLIEGTCLGLAQRHLDDGETTVGTHICVSHDAAVPVGGQVTVWCRLATVDRRRLEFEVRVEASSGKVSEGTHRRAVIDTSRFG